MEYFIELVKAFADGLLIALQLAMLVRAVMSWFPISEDSAVAGFLYTVTEPVIMPVRRFLERFESLRNFPLDISFFVTFLLISAAQALLFP